jgi:hypothetical protein
MERHYEVMIELLKEQLIVQKAILTKLKSIEDNMPREVSTIKIERLLESIGDVIVNLER